MAFNFDMAKTYLSPIKQEYQVTQPDISNNTEKKEEKKEGNGIADVVTSIMSSSSSE